MVSGGNAGEACRVDAFPAAPEGELRHVGDAVLLALREHFGVVSVVHMELVLHRGDRGDRSCLGRAD